MDPRIRIHNSDSNRIQVSYNNIDVKKTCNGGCEQAGISRSGIYTDYWQAVKTGCRPDNMAKIPHLLPYNLGATYSGNLPVYTD